jgi:hypothetical protein
MEGHGGGKAQGVADPKKHDYFHNGQKATNESEGNPSLDVRRFEVFRVSDVQHEEGGHLLLHQVQQGLRLHEQNVVIWKRVEEDEPMWGQCYDLGK